jgi:hypothetical protein
VSVDTRQVRQPLLHTAGTVVRLHWSVRR